MDRRRICLLESLRKFTASILHNIPLDDFGYRGQKSDSKVFLRFTEPLWPRLLIDQRRPSSVIMTSESTDDSFESWSIAWYTGMCVIAVFNMIVATYLFKHRKTNSTLPLAIIFVFVCGYRSIFPTLYLSNTCFIPGPESSPLLARMLAFVGEICWITQVALSIINASLLTGRRVFVRVLCYLSIFIIFCAEIFSTIGTVTKNSLWFTLEEGSWVFAAATCLTPSVALVYYDFAREPVRFPHPSLGNYLKICGITLFIYDFWGVTMDVPSNYGRWIDEQDSDDSGWKTLTQGLSDIFNACDLDRGYDTWGGYLLWMTSYFSLCVWSSIVLALLTFEDAVKEKRKMVEGEGKGEIHDKLLPEP